MTLSKEAIAGAKKYLGNWHGTGAVEPLAAIIQGAIEEATTVSPETRQKIRESRAAESQSSERKHEIWANAGVTVPLSPPQEWIPYWERIGIYPPIDYYIPKATCDKHNAALAAEREKREQRELAYQKLYAENVEVCRQLAAEREKTEQAYEIGNAAITVEREENKELCYQLAAAVEALKKLRDCDFVITPHDRMDAVRDIARAALAKCQQKGGDVTSIEKRSDESTKETTSLIQSNAAPTVQSAGAARCSVCGSKVAEDGTGIPEHLVVSETPFYNARLSNVSELVELAKQAASAEGRDLASAQNHRAGQSKRTPMKPKPAPEQ